MHWTPTVCAGVMLGRQPQDPRNFKWKHGTGMETNPLKWMKKQKLFVIKCFPCSQPSALTCIITFRRVHGFGSVRVHLCAFVRRETLQGREVSAFSLSPFFFFAFPSFTFCRRWHITISGQKSSLLSSPRETVPVSLFRLTSGGALRAFWLNPLSFPLDTLYLNTMHGAEPRCAGDFPPPPFPMGYYVHN